MGSEDGNRGSASCIAILPAEEAERTLSARLRRLLCIEST